jgi:hypothetical protein
MSLNSKRLCLGDVRLKIFTEMEADLEAQFPGAARARVTGRANAGSKARAVRRRYILDITRE